MKQRVYSTALRAVVLCMAIATAAGAQVYPMSWDSSRPVPARARVPETGQTTIYAPGDDGDLQMGVLWPIPRFTDNGDGTVTDNLTGLMWLQDADCFGPRTWQGALSQIVLFNTSPVSCIEYVEWTFTDWRLPNVRELLSLVSYAERTLGFTLAVPNTLGTGPWVEGDPFTRIQPSFYWSSTTFQGSTDNARGIVFRTGIAGASAKGNSGSVWPVRGGQ